MTKKGKIWMWSIIGFLVVSVLITFCFPVFCDISHFERNPYDSLCWFATEVFAYDKVENSDGCTGVTNGGIEELATEIAYFRNEFYRQVVGSPVNSTNDEKYFNEEHREDWYLFLYYELRFADPFETGSAGDYNVNSDLYENDFQQVYGELPDRDNDGYMDILYIKPPQERWRDELDNSLAKRKKSEGEC